jgi:hypothetical protein
VKRLLTIGVTAAAMLSGHGAHSGVAADELLQLQVSPSVCIAPGSVVIRAIVEHDARNRGLELVADSSGFYRRSVVDLDGERAPKVNELRLIAIPGGEYEITATLYDSLGDRTVVRRTLMVTTP